jgi:nucleosome binding factor SPN SPT16 subunit
VSNDDQLHFGTIICSLGARYRHYCSNVTRTYFVDPDKVRGAWRGAVAPVVSALNQTPHD